MIPSCASAILDFRFGAFDTVSSSTINEHGDGILLKFTCIIERAGEARSCRVPVYVHMLRHSTGYALAARGMDTRRLQHYLGHASITNTVRYTAMSPGAFKDMWR